MHFSVHSILPWTQVQPAAAPDLQDRVHQHLRRAPLCVSSRAQAAAAGRAHAGRQEGSERQRSTVILQPADTVRSLNTAVP
jgi:hypothetical protein